MPPASDRSPTSGRRILSRLSSPFATSKSRHIADFAVNPDDEHRQYAPGDTVTGHVRLRVAKPIRVTHLVICLHGFVQVYKQPGSPAESPAPNTRGKKSGEHFGNGFASLFEDEVVLCGDGRLAEGPYQFNFELLFPDHALPSSIDFERGTICYMITATLTRPNAISPTVSCERKVTLVERIDIAPLYPPKARTITLTPLPKRSRAKHSSRKLGNITEQQDNADSIRSASNTPRQSDASSDHSGRAGSQTPASARQSESSYAVNGSNAQPAPNPDVSSWGSPSPSDTGRSQETKASLRTETSRMEKVVTVTMESLVGGCLQGDSIPVKVDVTHTKPVRSLYGVIVTLFRQARVDMRPSAPLEPVEKGKDSKTEEYYPKSVTGLGGLSLSGAGSSHVFRKDLSQAVRPLYVDPNDLIAEVHARVRVPDEAFPTITTVPGSIISFRYYVEVIVDIQGKLQGQEKGIINVSGERGGAPQFGSEDQHRARAEFSPSGSTIIDTAQVRRDKGVVTCTFEVIVGTKDSERKGKRKVQALAAESEAVLMHTPPSAPPMAFMPDSAVHEYGMGYYQDSPWYDANYGYATHDSTLGQYYWPYPENSYHDPPPAPPIPQTQDETQMTEKERIQQAEIRLLPSQPPGAGHEQADGLAGATAPYLRDGSEEYSEHASLGAAPEYGAIASSSAVSSSRAPTRIERADLAPGPSAPGYVPHKTLVHPPTALGGAGAQAWATERHDAEPSAPPLESSANNAAESATVSTAAPSAPTLEEVDGVNVHDSHADAAGSSDLPQYER